MVGLVYDFLQSCRLLRRQAAFASLAILLLGLGIGAGTVLFSAFDALLLRPLPVLDPDRLVRPVRVRPGGVGPLSDFRKEVYLAMRERASSFEDVCASSRDVNAAYQDGELPERIKVQAVSASYFAVFGVKARLGRALLPDDDVPVAGTPAAVLSFDFWKRRYAEDPGVLGRKILVLGHPFLITGVLPQGFSGASIDMSPDVRVPLSSVPLLFGNESVRRGDILYEIIARLRAGVSLQSARDEAHGLFRAAMELVLAQHPDMDDQVRGYEVPGDFRLESIVRGTSRLRTQYSNAVILSIAAVGVLLLMLCANISGLLLARFVTRRHEFALRLAVGASPARLFRLATVECLLLASGGCVLGLALAQAMLPLLVRTLPPVRLLDATTAPLALQIGLDVRVAAFAITISLITALIIALAPALQAARTDLQTVLRDARAPCSSRGRSLLLMTQVALSVVLLVSAGLLVNTLRTFRAVDPGFARHTVISFALDPSLAGRTPEQLRPVLERFVAQVKAIPGVREAAFSSRPLMRGTGFKFTVAPAGERPDPNDFMNASIHVVSADYFATLGLRLITGRTYGPADFLSVATEAGKPRPVVVNQAFIRRFFADSTPLGKRFGTTGQSAAKPDYEIVGVVSDAKYRSLREPVPPTVYQPLRLSENFAGVLHVRTEAAPASAIQPVRQLLRQIERRLPITEATTLEEDLESSLWTERAMAVLAGAFSLLAILIVAAGLYALISFLVSQRTREIGIRIAVGARPADIFGLISRQTAGVITAGILIGLAVSLPVGRAMQSLLYGVSPADLGPMTAAVLLILAVTAAAAFAPVLRALRTEPALALRHDG